MQQQVHYRLPLSWARSIQSTLSQPIPRSTVSSHLGIGLPCGLFPSHFISKTLYATLLSPHVPQASINNNTLKISLIKFTGCWPFTAVFLQYIEYLGSFRHSTSKWRRTKRRPAAVALVGLADDVCCRQSQRVSTSTLTCRTTASEDMALRLWVAPDVPKKAHDPLRWTTRRHIPETGILKNTAARTSKRSSTNFKMIGCDSLFLKMAAC